MATGAVADLDASGFEYLVEGSPDGIVLHIDHRITYANAAAARILGFDRAQDLLGVCLSDFLEPRILASVRRRIIRMVATGENMQPLGLVVTAQDGRKIEVEVKSAPFPMAGNRTAIQTVLRDLSDGLLNEARYRSLVDHSAETVVLLDLNGTITYANPGLMGALGYDRDAVVGRSALEFLHPDSAEARMTEFASLLEGPPGTGRTVDLELRGADGNFRVFEGVANNLTDDPFLAGVMISLRDVTIRREAEHRLAGQSRALSMLADGEAVEPILEVITGLIQEGIKGSACVVRAKGTGDEIWGPLAWSGFPPELGAQLGRLDSGPWLSCATSGQALVCEKLADEPGLKKWARMTAKAGFRSCTCLPLLRSSDREVLGVLTVYGPDPLRPGDAGWVVAKSVADLLGVVLERTRANAELVKAADFDALTGLPGRRFMVRYLAGLLAEQANVAAAHDARLQPGPKPGAVRRQKNRMGRVTLFSMDLDRFKVVNDSLGHLLGDLVIKAVAERIVSVLGPDDLVARFGGDEFIICCREVRGRKEAEVLATGITAAFAEPVVVDGRSVFVTLSIGVAASGDGVDRPEELIRNADAAMYRAKDLGRARVVVYDAAFSRRARDRMELDHDLHVALDQGQFHLAYQPLFDLQTGLARGTEALLRWEHPERGVISPAEFVPVAEESALIIPIGEWVLDTACRQLAQWRSLLGPSRPLSVGVNMSMVQLASPGLSAMVARVMRRTGINPCDLSLEITESALLVDNPAGIEILNELRALGLHLALDDFGTGYSSLSYLRRFPVDMVKVDRAFVDGLGSGDEDDAIVAAIIFMARALGYVSVAEGVETPEQLKRLRALGCDLAQGYLLGRPASAEEMTRVFTAGPVPPLDGGQKDLWSIS